MIFYGAARNLAQQPRTWIKRASAAGFPTDPGRIKSGILPNWPNPASFQSRQTAPPRAGVRSRPIRILPASGRNSQRLQGREGKDAEQQMAPCPRWAPESDLPASEVDLQGRVDLLDVRVLPAAHAGMIDAVGSTLRLRLRRETLLHRLVLARIDVDDRHAHRLDCML